MARVVGDPIRGAQAMKWEGESFRAANDNARPSGCCMGAAILALWGAVALFLWLLWGLARGS